MEPIADVFHYFVRERYNIYRLRKAGVAKPWTKDPILQNYRFCNVYRELDTVTQWIDNHWRTPLCARKDLWFVMVIARVVNWPPTLKRMNKILPWNKQDFVECIEYMQIAGKKAFSGAYIVGTNGVRKDKAQYLAENVLGPLWYRRKYIRPQEGDTLDAFHKRLIKHQGMGSFLAAQIVADMKYVQPLLAAQDWHSFAASGPGSRRGLNRICGKPNDTPWREKDWYERLLATQARLNSRLLPSMPPLHAQDVQNCLCEFDKYMRVKNGEGTPRSRYPGV